MPSLIAKLLVGPRPDRPTGAHEKQMTWNAEDIARMASSGDLVIDAQERVEPAEGHAPISIALAFARCLPLIVSESRTTFAGSGPQPDIVQDLILDLVDRGGLSDDERRQVATRALEGGADRAFLVLSQDWPVQERLAFLTEPEKAYVAGNKVSRIMGAMHAGMLLLVRTALSDGLDVHHASANRIGLGHMVSSPDILPDLKTHGLDPFHADHQARLPQVFWSSTYLTAPQQKKLVEQWSEVFFSSMDPKQVQENAIRNLLSGLDTKGKGVLASHLKAAGLKPSSLVDGRPLVQHLARALVLRWTPSSNKTPSLSSIRWLVEQAPVAGEARIEVLWQLRVALAFGHDHNYAPMLGAEVASRSDTRGLARMDLVASALEGLCEPHELAKGWAEVYAWAVSPRSDVGNIQEEDRLVTDPQCLSWFLAPGTGSRSRVLEICEQASAGDSSWLAAQVLELHGKVVHPPVPLPGEPTDWLALAFRATCAEKGRFLTRPAGAFPGELELNEASRAAADLLARLWEQGVRPDPNKLPAMIEWARASQPGALPALETCLLENTTAPAPSKPRGMRL